MHNLKLSSTDKPIYPPWQQLTREAVKHIKSEEFRTEFFKLVRNDDIHIRLLTLHMYLLADTTRRLRTPLNTNFKRFYELKFRLGNSYYPEPFNYFLYKHFFVHLPSELFMGDFKDLLRVGKKDIWKSYGKLFKAIDEGKLSEIEETKEALETLSHEVVCLEQVEREDPIICKLALYTLAHRNYLNSLPVEALIDYKVNWGL